MRYGMSVLVLSGVLIGCVQVPAQSSAGHPRSSSSRQTSVQQDEAGGESSSRSTKIDLNAPAGEAPAIGVGEPGDVQEMKPWDPHKADKSIEVGDYYFKQKNYRAAESRYLEALYWQDNNAIANFRLAQSEEKLGKPADALKHYTEYLKILPDGEFAAQAKAGVARTKGTSSEQSTTAKQRK